LNWNSERFTCSAYKEATPLHGMKSEQSSHELPAHCLNYHDHNFVSRGLSGSKVTSWVPFLVGVPPLPPSIPFSGNGGISAGIKLHYGVTVTAHLNKFPRSEMREALLPHPCTPSRLGI
jgi:hypothetical protein